MKIRKWNPQTNWTKDEAPVRSEGLVAHWRVSGTSLYWKVKETRDQFLKTIAVKDILPY